MKAKAKTRRPKKYPRHRASTLIMGCGGKGKPKKVIDGGQLLEYVGIGWIPLREATKRDYSRYPELTD